ncbi:fungal-specific transcription factor domain-containing protein [Mycena polygramma]|nr:fungal-specific transcription factor domain-containing protein [Mycena polygramma]
MNDLEAEGLPVPGSKRRRLRGSCDICKQRKIRCDSSQMPGNKCSNCISFNSECTHTPTPKAVVPKKHVASKTPPGAPTDNDKSAKAHVAAIVMQATSYIGDTDVRRVLLDVARYARSLENELASHRRSSSVPSSLSSMNSPSPPQAVKEEETDTFVNGILTDRFDRFRMDSDLNRYFGKSSHFELINTAIDIKSIAVNPPEVIPPPVKRPLFWRSPWEYDHLAFEDVPPPLVFPEPDLLRILVDIFFAKVHIVLPFLYRPAFEKSLATGLHIVDHQFGSTVLGVCAVAAKYCDDPRVVLEGTETRLSSGWQYYRQLQPTRRSLMRPFTLYEAQTICLCVFYLQGSSAPDGCWALLGAGVRYAQDVGAHRRNRYDDKVLDEQWKRVFWMLICIDTLASSFCGRPRATSDDDYDLDYPLEVDDEYWEASDPGLAFKQPPERPSIVSYFTAYLKLMEIIGMAQKTIYLVNQKNRTEEWIQDTVVSLDSALNNWIDSIPVHLRWDPHMEDPVFATQSAVLYACYYHVQIQIHRIFIVSPGGRGTQKCKMPYNYPSLAICANSARACSHVMEVASKRGFLCNPHTLNAVFDACIVLLLNVWGGRFVGLTVDPQKCLQDVDICLRVFRAYETRWQIAGRQHDIIMELMNATNMDGNFTPNPLKRGRAPDPETRDVVHASNQFACLAQGPSSQPIATPAASNLDIDALFALPMYTEDLGRLPVYEPLKWDTSNWGKDLQDGHVADNVAPPGSFFQDLTGAAQFSDPLAVFTETPAGYEYVFQAFYSSQPL